MSTMVKESPQARRSAAVWAARVNLARRLAWDPAAIAAHRRAALRETLSFALRHSRWHHDRLAGINLDRIAADDLGLPVMTRTGLMANWDRIVTDPDLTLASARAHLQVLDEGGAPSPPRPVPGAGHRRLDGGTRGVLQTDPGDGGVAGGHRTLAVHRRPGSAHGVCQRRRPLPEARLGRAAGLPVRPAAGPAARPRRPAARIDHRAPQRAATRRAAYLLLDPRSPGAGGCRGVAPAQPDTTAGRRRRAPGGCRRRRAGHIRSAPHPGLSTTDVGHIAAEEAGGNDDLYVNDDLLVLEAVDEADRPVACGQCCHHLLVTSLYQRTLPMIRYRIDDRVILEPPSERHPAFARIGLIDGRSGDLFNYRGLIVHPHAFRAVIARHRQIRDYRVRQTADGAAISIVAGAPVDVDVITSQFVAALTKAGLTDPRIEVIRVGRITRTASGKQERFVPGERRTHG